MNDTGQRIRARRRALKLSQEQLAQVVKVTTSTIQKWEAGRTVPRVDKAVRLARALGTTLLDLFEDDAA